MRAMASAAVLALWSMAVLLALAASAGNGWIGP